MAETPSTETLWRCIVRCRTCRTVLNTAHGVPESEKGRLEWTAAFVSVGSCGHSTFSDLNWHIDLEWEKES